MSEDGVIQQYNSDLVHIAQSWPKTEEGQSVAWRCGDLIDVRERETVMEMFRLDTAHT